MLHLFVFSLFATQLAWLASVASQLSLWWALLYWPAASFGIVALGYAGLGGHVMGKRPNGTHHPLAHALHLPFLLTNALSAALFMWRHRADTPFHEIRPDLWLGRKVTADALPVGIQHVVDMTAELRGLGATDTRTYRTLPTLDGRSPDRAALESLAREVSRLQGPVYIHCLAGRGRSATLMAAVLLERGEASSAEEAERLAHDIRPDVCLSRPQRDTLAAIYAADRPPGAL